MKQVFINLEALAYHGNNLRIIKAHRMTIQFWFLRGEELFVRKLYTENNDKHNADHGESHILEKVPMVVVTDTIV